MSGEIIKSERLRESYRRIKHKSGCTICLYPMPEYSTAYAIFGTRYGSVDTTFKTAKDSDYVTVPEGIAHYLEHKLFENDECDAFELYAKTGASANAFTSFDSTAYLFSCSQCFEENLRILLGFVQEPYFTDENIEKERGIIAQEIKMYLDDPGTRVFFNCLNAVYHTNPVRIDIAGTVESIQKIDKELLYRCYNTFYNPNNMVLSIAGNFDPDKALEICDELLKSADDPELDMIVPKEPEKVREEYIVQQLPCAVPLFNLGFKMPLPPKEKQNEDYIVYNIMLEAALGSFSDFYSRLYDEGLINDTFGVGVFSGRGFFLPNICGESREPKRVKEEIISELERLKKEGISRHAFETVKKMTYGELIAPFNNVENVARGAMQAEFSGQDIYTNVEITADVRYEDVEKALEQLDTVNCSLSVVEPTE